MTYRLHTLVTIGGSLFNEEEWSIGVRLHNGAYDAQTPEGINNANQAALEDLWADAAAFVTDQDGAFSSRARLEWVKANAIGANGRYAEEGRTVAYFAPQEDWVVGLRDAAPAQNALVYTLRGDRDRGRASRGRFYVPAGRLAIDSATGRIPAASCQGYAAAGARFIEALNDWPGIDLPSAPTVHVISELGNPGPIMEVDRVLVGDVVDTQRRRRNQMPETYYGVDVAGV